MESTQQQPRTLRQALNRGGKSDSASDGPRRLSDFVTRRPKTLADVRRITSLLESSAAATATTDPAAQKPSACSGTPEKPCGCKGCRDVLPLSKQTIHDSSIEFQDDGSVKESDEDDTLSDSPSNAESSGSVYEKICINGTVAIRVPNAPDPPDSVVEDGVYICKPAAPNYAGQDIYQRVETICCVKTLIGGICICYKQTWEWGDDERDPELTGPRWYRWLPVGEPELYPTDMDSCTSNIDGSWILLPALPCPPEATDDSITDEMGKIFDLIHPKRDYSYEGLAALWEKVKAHRKKREEAEKKEEELRKANECDWLSYTYEIKAKTGGGTYYDQRCSPAPPPWPGKNIGQQIQTYCFRRIGGTDKCFYYYTIWEWAIDTDEDGEHAFGPYWKAIRTESERKFIDCPEEDWPEHGVLIERWWRPPDPKPTREAVFES